MTKYETLLDEIHSSDIFYFKDDSMRMPAQGNRLISLNSKYEPVVISEFDSFYTAGRVIGKVE
jgi:hypothetical protein